MLLPINPARKAIAALLTQLLVVLQMYGVARPEWLTDDLLVTVGGIITVALVYFIPDRRGGTP